MVALENSKDMSAIQKRIITELRNGTVLSVKNMYKLRCSNISRELRRQFEIPFGITLDRKRENWVDDFGHGHYFLYSLNPSDKEKLEEIYKKIVLEI